MTTLAAWFHEQVLRHGGARVEVNATRRQTRRRGTVIECPCGRRWLGRAPWWRHTW